MAAIKMGQKTITGNVATDPSVMEHNGNTWVKVRLAEQQREFVKGQWQDGEKVYYDVAIRDKQLGQHVLNSVLRGDRLTASGNYTISPYTDANGNEGINHNVYANDVSVSLKFTDVSITREQNQDYGPRISQGAARALQNEQDNQAPVADTVRQATEQLEKQYGINDRSTVNTSAPQADPWTQNGTRNPSQAGNSNYSSQQPPRSPNPGQAGPPVAPAPRNQTQPNFG